VARAALGEENIPRYSADLPPGGTRRKPSTTAAPDAVAFPSCTTTMFGAGHGLGVDAAFRELCRRADVGLVTPAGLAGLCCGTPWKSKGMQRGLTAMSERVGAALVEATRGGELPVVCDASSCTEGLTALLAAAGASIRVVDAVQFTAEQLLPRLPAARRLATLTLHPTCSSVRLGIDGSLQRVADAVAEEVRIPDDWGCCAFAGDRGLLHPALTASATAAEAAEVRQARSEAHASLNRTCELGMTRATGYDYRHLLEILEEATR